MVTPRLSSLFHNTASEIHLDKARLYAESPQVGDIVEQELDPAYLGRIAARTAEQAIKQRLRQFEKEHIYDEFRDQVGGLVTGTVRRKEGDLVVEVGKAEALLPWRGSPEKTGSQESASVAFSKNLSNKVGDQSLF